MTRLLTTMSACLFLALTLTMATASADEAGFKSLFDGQSLKGWEGKSEFWSVSNGAITGQTTKENPTKGNTFLIWRDGKVGDFELRLKFRIDGGNSGIQYRSEELDGFVVKGYQADIDVTNKFIGILYGEKTGRGIIAQRAKKIVIDKDGKKEVVGDTCNEQELLASIKKGDWNDYTIIAKGTNLVQKINGFTTVDLTDNHKDAKSSGILALQLHAGPPMLIQFKDIRLKTLK